MQLVRHVTSGSHWDAERDRISNNHLVPTGVEGESGSSDFSFDSYSAKKEDIVYYYLNLKNRELEVGNVRNNLRSFNISK